ncbi:MAG TPA: hypothetical protein VFJ74_05865 [Gemmatimonadaceae bacterium]|nr:hypothetical protein [Gemmatimonadaceae bacterium]
MTDGLLEAWLAARRPAPPPALARRLREVLAGNEPNLRSCRDAAESLLARLLDEDCAVRDSALDLLVADSLVTYAFEIAADDPTSLEGEAELAMRRIAAFGDESVATSAGDRQVAP